LKKKNKQEQKEDVKLKKVLSAFDLVMMGVGCIIGVGIYILSGVVASNYAGPAIIISFVLAALLCGIVAFCYAELASLIPVSGSAYSYSYYAFGRKVAWFLGWTLLLEYIVAASAVAVGWSSYFQKFLKEVFNLQIPDFLIKSSYESFSEDKLSFNLVSALAMGCLALMNIRGIKESAKLNNVVALIKILVLIFFIAFGISFIDFQNWFPFFPERIATTKESIVSGLLEIPVLELLINLLKFQNFEYQTNQFWHYGTQGILTGTAIVFFTYVGFDMVSSTAEESKNPRKDLPIGIIGSLVITTVLYILVTLVLIGIVPPVVDGVPNQDLSGENAGSPLAVALSPEVTGKTWPSLIILTGALSGVTTSLLTLSLAFSRILWSIARDKFLPGLLTKVHPKYKTPYFSILIGTIFTIIIAGSLPISKLAELCNLGTLVAFIFVCASVLILRKKSLDSIKSQAVFLCPGFPFLPILGIITCLILIFSLPLLTWIWFSLWLFFGFLIYFCYGRKKASKKPKFDFKN